MSKRDFPINLQLRTPADFAARQTSQYVLKSLFNRGEFIILYGKAGTGKSLIALALFFQVARRQEQVFGLRCRGGPVLYICLEGASGFRARVKAVEATYGSAEQFYVCTDRIALSDSRYVKAVISAANEIGAVAIVIDTIAQATSGIDESSHKDMSQVVSAINDIASRTGAAVCVIDHVGWSANASNRPRGHSGKWAASDVALCVDGDVKSGHAKLLVVRMKDGMPARPIGFQGSKVDLGVDEDGDPIASYVATQADAQLPQSPTLGPTLQTDLRTISQAAEASADGERVISRVACRDAFRRIGRAGFRPAQRGRSAETSALSRILKELEDKGLIESAGDQTYRISPG